MVASTCSVRTAVCELLAPVSAIALAHLPATQVSVWADGRAIGACDLVMDPANPKILYAATYDKERKPWTFNLAGPGSGIYKTTDAGKTWTRIVNGFPSDERTGSQIHVIREDPKQKIGRAHV